MRMRGWQWLTARRASMTAESGGAGRTSPLGVGLQVTGLATLVTGLWLWSPAAALVTLGLLLLVAGERL